MGIFYSQLSAAYHVSDQHHEAMPTERYEYARFVEYTPHSRRLLIIHICPASSAWAFVILLVVISITGTCNDAEYSSDLRCFV